MTTERLYYCNPITETGIRHALAAAVGRKQRSTLVMLPLGCKLEIDAVDGVPVTIEERVKPAPTHFVVVME